MRTVDPGLAAHLGEGVTTTWDLVEIPLGEDSEAYIIDILDRAHIRRTLTTATPSTLYVQTDELADFGAAQTTLSLTVAQVSPVVGRGFATRVTIPVL